MTGREPVRLDQAIADVLPELVAAHEAARETAARVPEPRRPQPDHQTATGGDTR